MSTFEDKVRRTVEGLKRGDLRAMAAEIARKRIAWLDRNWPETGRASVPRPADAAGRQITPRQAFKLLFFDQMGLDPDDLPVMSETETEIVWLSRNRCSLLEACLALGLDTRRVCRPVNEKATQAFLSRLDPQLRFHRSYEEIRPTAGHCRESILRIDFEATMRVAIAEAHRSRAEGNKGYGAVVVFEDRIVGRAHDTAVTARDPSLHAEVNAIRQAVQTLGDADLCGAILFCTCEPCPMCAALAVWANVTTIVYGASIAETASLGRTRIRVSAKEIVARSPAAIDVVGNVLHDECLALYA
jgi:tRNA(Arg) A34 adenosine deaminase TadA